MGNNIVGCALLLGILIFLPEPSEGLAPYSSSCERNGDCETGFCLKNVCDCTQSNEGQLVQFFNKANNKCDSAVGKACTFKPEPPLPSYNCVDNAECKRIRHRRLSKKFGQCMCKEGYEENDDHLCVMPHEIITQGQLFKPDDNDKYIAPKGKDWPMWPISKSASTSKYVQNHSSIYIITAIFLLFIQNYSVR